MATFHVWQAIETIPSMGTPHERIHFDKVATISIAADLDDLFRFTQNEDNKAWTSRHDVVYVCQSLLPVRSVSVGDMFQQGSIFFRVDSNGFSVLTPTQILHEYPRFAGYLTLVDPLVINRRTT